MAPLPSRLLAAVTFERGALHALRYARALSEASHAEVYILHVIPLASCGRMSARDRWWMTLASKTLASLARRAGLGPSTRIEVRAGPVASTIADFAREQQCDLLILGGRASPDWHGSLLGPTAAALLRDGRLPVLVIPSPAAAQRVRRSA